MNFGNLYDFEIKMRSSLLSLFIKILAELCKENLRNPEHELEKVYRESEAANHFSIFFL